MNLLNPFNRVNLIRQLGNQVEDRQIHRDDDAADDDAEKRDHDRLEQRQQAATAVSTSSS